MFQIEVNGEFKMEIGKPESKPLKSILKDIDNGSIKLPEFQRDFRWEIGDVIDLIISILRGFPAGVLLFWNVSNKKDKLAERPFEGADRASANTMYQVLDGQQRLTSLYQLFYKEYVVLKGGRERKFFINLEKLKKQEYDDCIEYFSPREVMRQKLNEVDVQISRKLLPLNILFDENKLRDWKIRFVSKYSSQQDSSGKTIYGTWEDCLKDFEENFLSEGRPLHNIIDYKFPIFILPSDLSLEAVTTIFEKLNTTGQPLNIFEILTAKFYQSLNLRELWEYAKEKNVIFNRYVKDEKDTTLAILILKAILLKKSLDDPNFKTLECKRKNLLEDLEASDVTRYWDVMVDAFAKSLNKISEEYGSPSLEYLPYTTMLTPFALILNYIEEEVTLTKKWDAYRKLERWYWSSVFSGRYDSATDTKTKVDVEQIIKWIVTEQEPSFIKEFDPKTLNFDEITSGARYKGVLALSIKNGCKDLCTKESIEMLLKHNPKDVDVHHVFPVRFLERRYGKDSVEYKKKDTVLNKILIKNETNRSYIKDDPPSVYIQSIKRFNPDIYKELERHLLPIDQMEKNDFNEFLEERKKTDTCTNK
jgi:hypothetical protein